jgi:hypothetical protein
MVNLEKNVMGRREFIGAAAAALFAGVAISVTGCGSTEDEDAPAGSKEAVVETVNGHTHEAYISKVQMDAGNAVTIDLATASGHTHTADLTAQQVVDIKAGTKVTVTSSTTGSHAHGVTFN